METCKSCGQEKKNQCSRCGRDLGDRWEQHFGKGVIKIIHASSLQEHLRINPSRHPAACFEAQNNSQEATLEWSDDGKYKMCWECNRELAVTIGEFFAQSPFWPVGESSPLPSTCQQINDKISKEEVKEEARRYRRKPQGDVRTYRVTEAHEVVVGYDKTQLAQPGEWVVLDHGERHYRVMTDEEFQATYEEVE